MDRLSPPDQPRANVRLLRSTAQASRRGRNWLHALCTCPRVLNCRPQQQFAGPAASSVCCQLDFITVSRAAAPCRQDMLLMLRHAEIMHSRPKLGVRRSCGRGLTLCTFVDADTTVSVSAMPLLPHARCSTLWSAHLTASALMHEAHQCCIQRRRAEVRHNVRERLREICKPASESMACHPFVASLNA